MDSMLIDARTRQALEAALKAFLHANGMPTSVKVNPDALQKGFARLRVELIGGGADPAVAFARQEATGWKILSFGTYFDSAFYDEERIPASLRL